MGLEIAGNHYLIHLALLIAQPCCMAYYAAYMCKTDENYIGNSADSHRMLGGSASSSDQM